MKKTKKLLCIMLTFLLLVSGGVTQLFSSEAFTFLAPTAQAAESSGSCGANGNNLTWVYNPETHELKILGSGAMADYDYALTPWFDFRGEVEVLSLPDGLTYTGSYAFYEFEKLTELTMPDTVKTVGESSFEYCKKLKTVKLSENLESIGEYGFYYCSSVTCFELPGSLKTIEKNAFGECHGLASFSVDDANTAFAAEDGVLFNKAKTLLIQYPLSKTGSTYTVPSTVTSIGRFAFSQCGQLISIQLPEGLKSIGYGAFEMCRGLTAIEIPQDVTDIGDFAFAYCLELASVNIPESVSSIGKDVFGSCRKLTSISVSEDNEHFTLVDGVIYTKDMSELVLCPCTVEEITIPDTVKVLRDYAFGSCDMLTEVVIPEGVTTIGESAFSDCYKLASLTIPHTVTSIGEGAFSTCLELTGVTLPQGLTEIKDGTFGGCSSLTSIEIPQGVTTIGSGVFNYCDELAEVTIPESVTTIDGILGYCPSLTSIKISEDNKHFIFVDGVLLNEKGTEMLFCVDKEEIIIPETVEKISDYAFSEYQKLTKIEIHAGVTTIGEGAFGYCPNLTEIKMYNSITSIAGWAFYDCPALEKVYFVGTQAQWDAIDKGVYNEALTSAELILIEPPVVKIQVKASPLVKVINSDIIAVSPTLTAQGLRELLTAGVELSEAKGKGVLYTGMTVILKDSKGKELDRLTVAVMGDLDSNGKVSAADARLALRQAVGLEALDEIHIIAARVGGAPKVAAAQARLILRASVGLENLQSLL